MQQQPQVVNFARPPPPAGQVYEERIQAQVQGEFINPPPGENRGVFATPLSHGQQPVVVQVAQGQAPQVASRLDPIELVNILLRFVAALMTLIAVAIIAATKYVNVESEEYYDDYTHKMKTRWNYTEYKLSILSSIKYFLAANSIVLIYSAGTLLISISSMLMKNKQGNDTLRNKLIIMLFVAGDLAAVVFLFSAVGSAAGSKDTLSNMFGILTNGTTEGFCKFLKDEFCDKWIAGIVMSMFGAVAYLLLQLLSLFSFIKMNNKN